MSGEILIDNTDTNLILEQISVQVSDISEISTSLSNGISLLICLLIVFVLIILLHYSYKFFDMFFC